MSKSQALSSPSQVDAKPSFDGSSNAQRLDIEFEAGRARFRVRLRVTPAGLLALGALVSGVLMASAGLVWSATSVARDHPIATRFKRR